MPIAAISNAAATWPFRSMVRSECCPSNTMPMPPKTKGNAASSPVLGIADPEVLDDGRQEEGNAVARRIQAEIDQRAHQNADVREGLKQGEMFDLLLVLFLGGLNILQPRNLVRLQPARLARKIGQIEQHAEADQDRRQRLENEQPLPAIQSPAGQVQQHPGDRRTR